MGNADFGEAKPTLGLFGRVAWSRVGTEGFKAPELLTNSTQEYATYALDWWSFGVTAVCLALGQRISFDLTSDQPLAAFVAEKLAVAKKKGEEKSSDIAIAGVEEDLASLLVSHLLVEAERRPDSFGSLVTPFWRHPFWTWTEGNATCTIDWTAVRKAGWIDNWVPLT